MKILIVDGGSTKVAEEFMAKVISKRGGARKATPWDLVAAAFYSYSGTCSSSSQILRKRLATELRKRGYSHPHPGAFMLPRSGVFEDAP